MMAFVTRRTQCRLRRLCRAIQYFSTIFLLLFLIYLCNGKHDGTAPQKRVTTDAVVGTKMSNVTCVDNTFWSSEGCLPCPRGMFSFSGWSECQPWLNCTDISLQVRPQRRIEGRIKEIWLADWNGHQVVYANCSNTTTLYKTLCWHGMTKMERLQGDFVTRLIGKCFDKLETVTAYYKHGDAAFLDEIFEEPEYSRYDNIQTRFQLSVDYVKILNFLHTSPLGVLVMCDASSLFKLLEQHLITDDFHLILNDLDLLPEVKREEGKFVICFSYEEDRELAAPEQRWPYKSIPFKQELMPAYDEKIDIWKIPAVVEDFLGDARGSVFAERQLRKMMKRCQAIDPVQRPTANEVLQELLRVQQLIIEKRYLSVNNRFAN